MTVSVKKEEKLEVTMIQWFDDHFYKIELSDKTFDYLPSVTTKLGVVSKPFLAQWRGDIGNREADLRVFEASQRGVRIHNAWYVLTIGGTVLYQPSQKPNYTEEQLAAIKGQKAILNYQDEMLAIYRLSKWLQIVKPKVLASEMICYSLLTRDAGTIDNVMEIEAGEYPVNGKTPLALPKGRYIVDLKSGKSVDEDAFMQTAAYAKCYESMGLGKIDGTLILHTGSGNRTGIEGVSTLYRSKAEVETDYADFRAASSLWERKSGDMRPKVFEFPSFISMNQQEVKNETAKKSN